jgi:Topoisomerase 6 subunit A/Spo11, Toprim domain
MTDFENLTAGLPSQPDVRNSKFERADWTSFRTVEGLQQKAGVPAAKLRKLVLKELADNALDAGAQVSVGELPGGGYFIEDDGPGIDGTPEEIARLFSIARPMVSTKLLRLPTRGALGNGLRVVAGSVLASDGFLIVTTGNRRIELRPERDGTTTVLRVTPVDFPVGTRVEIGFGPAIPAGANALRWAVVARQMARGSSYAGKSSPWWYDVPQFHELLSASGSAPVRELVARLDGCSGGKAGEIVTEAGLGRMACADVTREQAIRLLEVARQSARDVNPKRLGAVGSDLFDGGPYGVSSGTVSFGTEMPAKIPYLVEAWARASQDMRMLVCVNRTPVSGDVNASRDKRDIDVFGCGLANTVAEAPKDKNFAIRLNITAPYMPITSDGKEPNLFPFRAGICNAVAAAVRKAHRPGTSAKRVSQKDIVLDNLDDAIAAVSGEEGYRFNARQLFYFLRPIVMDETGKELKIENFTAIITDFEAENGEIPLMYREPRGSITHPHRDETITLGTLMVEEYERPAWNFNTLLYIEKEGAQEALKQDRWLERHDCAVMSSKGFSTRAARDLIDKLAEHNEPVTVFCVHDADASGTMIYQTLQEATKARGARKVEIINLGLEPWEAVAMGLEVENLEEKDRQKPVADYVRDADWVNWLQTNRVELNAMTTPQLIEWLDQKMAEHGDGKLIPPVDVLERELAVRIERRVREEITERILREARLDKQVAATIAAIQPPDGKKLAHDIAMMFKQQPDAEWHDHIEAEAHLDNFP